MKNRDFIRLVAENISHEYKNTKFIIDTIFKLIEDRVASWDKVVISSFWRFDSVIIKERKWVNPQTLESIIIPELTRAKFVPSKKFKTKLNKWM